MAMTTHKIDSYKVRIFGNDKVGNEWRWATKIIELYSDGMNVATANFAARDQKAGECSFTLNHIILNAPEEQYASVIDLLRNEFPVYITWVPHTDSTEPDDGDAFFETAKEVAGEGEVSQPRNREPRTGPIAAN